MFSLVFVATTQSWLRERQGLTFQCDEFEVMSIQVPCPGVARRWWKSDFPVTDSRHPVNELKHAYMTYRMSYNCALAI